MEKLEMFNLSPPPDSPHKLPISHKQFGIFSWDYSRTLCTDFTEPEAGRSSHCDRAQPRWTVSGEHMTHRPRPASPTNCSQDTVRGLLRTNSVTFVVRTSNEIATYTAIRSANDRDLADISSTVKVVQRCICFAIASCGASLLCVAYCVTLVENRLKSMILHQ